MDYSDSSETIGTPIQKLLTEKKKKRRRHIREYIENSSPDEEDDIVDIPSSKRKYTRSKPVDYFTILTNGVIAAGIFVIITIDQIQSLYGSYIPQFYDENKKITFKGKILQAILLVILFVIVKVWVLDSKT